MDFNQKFVVVASLQFPMSCEDDIIKIISHDSRPE